METDRLAGMMGSLVSGGPWLVIKIMFVVGLCVYLMFGLIILRQAHIMNETIEAKYNGLVKMGARIHFGLTLFILIVSILFL